MKVHLNLSQRNFLLLPFSCLQHISDKHYNLISNHGSPKQTALRLNDEEQRLEVVNIQHCEQAGLGGDSSCKRYGLYRRRCAVSGGFATGTEQKSKRLHFLENVVETIRPRWCQADG